MNTPSPTLPLNGKGANVSIAMKFVGEEEETPPIEGRMGGVYISRGHEFFAILGKDLICKI